MTTTTRPPGAAKPPPQTPSNPNQPRSLPLGRVLIDIFTTTDHKKIGYLYLSTSFF